MLAFVNSIVTASPLISDGHCDRWQPGLVALHILGDWSIAFSYCAIAIALIYRTQKHPDYNWKLLLFSALIVAGATTHIMECLNARASSTGVQRYPQSDRSNCVNFLITRPLQTRGFPHLHLRSPTSRRKPALARNPPAFDGGCFPLAFYVVDNRSDEILYFNHRFCQIWGIEHLEAAMQRGELKNNEIIPDCLPQLVDVPAFAESCKPLQTEENRDAIEDEIPFTQGRTIRRFSTQIRDESDRYFGRLYLFEDISDRKQAETALKESEIRFQAFMDNSPTAAWITNDKGRILYLNPAYYRQFNVPNSYQPGKTDLSFSPPNSGKNISKTLVKSSTANKP
uniref:PAS domain-containing protein n=1 Tax=Desertifilum tharense IPPAS B-1220 TaxID=1781255 RepID=A0ACD5GQC1_9CYAN